MPMTERPILFSGPMVRAILEGRKTQTRRVLKSSDIANVSSNSEFRSRSPYPLAEDNGGLYHYVQKLDGRIVGIPCPYGKPGDRLWGRETWAALTPISHQPIESVLAVTSVCVTVFAATEKDRFEKYGGGLFEGPWKPSIFMPRWASRITLEIVSVRVERLQDISGKDILAEGAVLRAHDNQFGHNPISAFDGACYMDLKSLWAAGWDTINGKKHPWASNPWVWVLGFSNAKNEQACKSIK